MRTLAVSVIFGVAITVVTFGVGVAASALGLPPLEWLADTALVPGFFLPEAYWGGVHDPLQVLIAFGLNVLFYAAAGSIALLLVDFNSRA